MKKNLLNEIETNFVPLNFKAMELSEELVVDAHVLEASNLRTTSIGYKGLKLLLSTGSLLSSQLGEDYSLFVNFTRMLDHLGLKYQFINSGLELQENSKQNYFQSMMCRKVPDVKPSYKYGVNRIGKEERTEYGGWIRTREEKKD